MYWAFVVSEVLVQWSHVGLCVFSVIGFCDLLKQQRLLFDYRHRRQ